MSTGSDSSPVVDPQAPHSKYNGGSYSLAGSGNLCLAFFVINVSRLSLPGLKISVNTSSRVTVPLSHVLKWL